MNKTGINEGKRKIRNNCKITLVNYSNLNIFFLIVSKDELLFMVYGEDSSESDTKRSEDDGMVR